jgi:hypothetical protein
LHDGAVDLPLVPDRVDDLPDIMSRGETQQLDLSGLRIDRDLRDLCRKRSDMGASALLDVRPASD